MKKITVFALGLTLGVLIFSGSHKETLAQEVTFKNIIPIDGGQGSIRFFDTSDGKLYTYDRTLQIITRIVQIEELGKPAKEILMPSADESFQ